MFTHLRPLGIMPAWSTVLDLVVRAILQLLWLYICLALFVFRYKLRLYAEHSSATGEVEAIATTRRPGTREPFPQFAGTLLAGSSVLGYVTRFATFCLVFGTIAEYSTILYARSA